MPDEHEKARRLREIASLGERARSARYAAFRISDVEAAAGLKRYAEKLEERADALEAPTTLPPAAAIPSGEPPITQAAAALKTETPPEPASGPSDKAEPEPA
jgi:hypothetical protein